MKTWETTRRDNRITVWSTDHREGWPAMTRRAIEMLEHGETLHRDGIDHGHVYRFTVKSVERAEP